MTNTGTANISNWSVNLNFQSPPRINGSWNAVLSGAPRDARIHIAEKFSLLPQ